ncbi:MAG: Flp family type IVb pilin [Planctomycetota bacterium]
MFSWIKRFAKDEEGAGLAEYAVLVALIAGVAAVGVLLFGNALLGWFNSAGADLGNMGPDLDGAGAGT